MKKNLILTGLTIMMGAVVCFANGNPGHEECDPRQNTTQPNCTWDSQTGCSGGCNYLVFTGCNDCNEGSGTCNAPTGACTSQVFTAGCITAGNQAYGGCECSVILTPKGKATPASNFCS